METESALPSQTSHFFPIAAVLDLRFTTVDIAASFPAFGVELDRMPRNAVRRLTPSAPRARGGRFSRSRSLIPSIDYYSSGEIYYSTDRNLRFCWRRRPDLNRGWRFCRPLPYHLATAPAGTVRIDPAASRRGDNSDRPPAGGCFARSRKRSTSFDYVVRL